MVKLLEAKFVSRPNRFIVNARLRNGRIAPCHLADPGRLKELLVSGAALRLRRAAPGSARKTAYSVSLVKASTSPFPWVSVDSTLPNKLAHDLLLQGKVKGIQRGSDLRREVTCGKSRFDFRASSPDGIETYIEVKSVTLVENGVARFPDAPTTRGARHVMELTRLVERGGRAMILFVVQRDDAHGVEPNRATDPKFAEALEDAISAGVLLRACRFRLSAAGNATYAGALPVRCL